MVKKGGGPRKPPKFTHWGRLWKLSLMSGLHPHPHSFSPRWFLPGGISFRSRGSPFPDSLAFLMAIKSPLIMRVLPRVSGARALCLLASGVGSFWRQQGRPSAVCPLPHALQLAALSCPLPVGRTGELRDPHARRHWPLGITPRSGGSGLRTEVTTRWRCPPCKPPLAGTGRQRHQLASVQSQPLPGCSSIRPTFAG